MESGDSDQAVFNSSTEFLISFDSAQATKQGMSDQHSGHSPEVAGDESLFANEQPVKTADSEHIVCEFSDGDGWFSSHSTGVGESVNTDSVWFSLVPCDATGTHADSTRSPETEILTLGDGGPELCTDRITDYIKHSVDISSDITVASEAKNEITLTDTGCKTVSDGYENEATQFSALFPPTAQQFTNECESIKQCSDPFLDLTGISDNMAESTDATQTHMPDSDSTELGDGDKTECMQLSEPFSDSHELGQQTNDGEQVWPIFATAEAFPQQLVASSDEISLEKGKINTGLPEVHTSAVKPDLISEFPDQLFSEEVKQDSDHKPTDDSDAVIIEEMQVNDKLTCKTDDGKDEFDFDFDVQNVVPAQSPPAASKELVDTECTTELMQQSLPSEPTTDVSLTAAAAEWDLVATLEPGAHGAVTVGLEPVTYAETLNHLQLLNLLDKYQSSIVTSVPRRGFRALMHSLCGAPQLHDDLLLEQDFVFCIAACPFNNDDTVHSRVLQTIYRQLTGAKVDCPRYGSHWEQIGFQGNDPATDLRGVGFLSLLQLLYFVTETKSQQLARGVYRLSQHHSQNFPFALMGINLTRICLLTLREDCLNRLCNRRSGVINVVNELYVGAFQQFYTTWWTQQKTIADSGFVLADLEVMLKKHPSRILELANRESLPVVCPSRRDDAAVDLNFANVVKLSEDISPGQDQLED